MSETFSDEESENDYYPMWTKVYCSHKKRMYYYNNFDGSMEWIKPEDYNVETDDNYITKEQLTYQDMPTFMKRLAASIKIQSVIARPFCSKTRIQCIRGDNRFNSMNEKERMNLTKFLNGWIEMNTFVTWKATTKRNATKYWYHPGMSAIEYTKPSGHDEGKQHANRIQEIEQKHADKIARRKAHKERMAQGFANEHDKVNTHAARRAFKNSQREKRAKIHQAKLEQLKQGLSEKHVDELAEKKQKKEEQAVISAQRAQEHQKTMDLELEKMHQKQNEHDKMIFNLERRASVILEGGSGPWKLHLGIKSAAGLRAADWALRGGGKSDPYVIIYLNGRQVGKTNVIKKTLNPIWDFDIDIEIENMEELGASSWATSTLMFEVYDYDLVGADDLLGQVSFKNIDFLTLVHLNQDHDGQQFTDEQINRAKNENKNKFLEHKEYNLCNPENVEASTIKKKEQAKGTLLIAADLRVVLKKRQVLHAKKDKKSKKKQQQLKKEHEEKMQNLNEQEVTKATYFAESGAEIAEAMVPLDQDTVLEWMLETTFISASGLKKADRFGKSDPYVKVSVNGVSIGSSKTIKKTLNPEWNQQKSLLIHRKKHFEKTNVKKWKNSELVFEVYDHDVVGTDDPLGRIVLKGSELLSFLTADQRGKGDEEVQDRQLFERNGKKSKGTLKVRATLKPAGSEAIAAVKAEQDRLAAIEASKIKAPWTVWMRMYDNIAHAECWVHSHSGLTAFELPIPANSTKEHEATKLDRVLPEDLASGPPLPYKQHMAALLIGKMMRRRFARTKILITRARHYSTNNGGGSNQIWVQAFHPYNSRNYYWHSKTNTIEWDDPPLEMKSIQLEWIRSYDCIENKYYYHQSPFDKDSWQWEIPTRFIPGGHTKIVDAAITMQATYRSFLSRMVFTCKRNRKDIFTFASLTSSGTPKKAKPKRQLKSTKDKAGQSTADEKAEIILNKNIQRLKDVIESFEVPFRHRCSRRSDRRKVLNMTQLVIGEAVKMSTAAGHRIAAAKGLNTPALGKPTTEGKLSRTTQEIMIDEVNAFAKKVKDASEAAEGSAAMVVWYEVETVYRLKRLLAGLTAMDIYQLSAPAQEDVGAAHEELKVSIKASEQLVGEMLGKLGKGFRKSLRRWDKMMKEDCGRALVSVSTSDLLPVDRSLDSAHIRADEGRGLADPLRYGKYYWMTLKKSRMMPFPVDMGGQSYKRMKKYISNMSNTIYDALKHAKRYLMLVGDERDKRIGREELLRMRRSEAHIRTAMYMAKLRAEKRAKQEVFNAMCRSQWNTGKQRKTIEEQESKLLVAKMEQKKRDDDELKQQKFLETIQENHRARSSPWEAIQHKAPIDVIHDKLTEEHRRWAFQEKKKFDVNSRNQLTGDSLVGNAVIFNHEDALQYLIDMGADVNQIDNSIVRSTPLIQAARRGDRWVGVARLLIQNGATLSAQDIRGDTALHVASRNGARNMVQLLLSCRNGSRSNKENKKYYPSEDLLGFEKPTGENVEDYGHDFRRMVAVPNNKAQLAIDLAQTVFIKKAIQWFYDKCVGNTDLNDMDLKYINVRKRKLLRLEQQRLAEDLTQGATSSGFGGGLVIAPLLGPMSSLPLSSDVPDSVKLRRRLEESKQKHKMRRLKGLPGGSSTH